MGTVKPGDRVRVTIEGVLQTDTRHDNTHMVRAGGYAHYLYLDGSTNSEYEGLTVEKLAAPEPVYEAHSAYMDGDDYVFIRTRDGKWIDANGTEWNHEDSFIEKPLRKLVPESE